MRKDRTTEEEKVVPIRNPKTKRRSWGGKRESEMGESPNRVVGRGKRKLGSGIKKPFGGGRRRQSKGDWIRSINGS